MRENLIFKIKIDMIHFIADNLFKPEPQYICLQWVSYAPLQNHNVGNIKYRELMKLQMYVSLSDQCTPRKF